MNPNAKQTNTKAGPPFVHPTVAVEHKGGKGEGGKREKKHVQKSDKITFITHAGIVFSRVVIILRNICTAIF